MELIMKKEEVLNIIVGKLISEGVSAKNYNTNDALMVLSHCVMPLKLQTYLVNYEEEVKMRLENLSQIKQKFTADEAEEHINQEVEKRIAETIAGKFIEVEIEKRIKERMLSKDEIIKYFNNHFDCHAEVIIGLYETTEVAMTESAVLKMFEMLRSRLTNPGVNDSQKTEGGGE